MSRSPLAMRAAWAVALMLAAACDDSPSGPTPITYPPSAQIASPQVWGTMSGVSIAGGYGSGLAVDPNDSTIFYILTDRGPNVATTLAGAPLLFPLPAFNPQIGKFRLDKDSLKLVTIIGLKTAAGAAITGIPNPSGVGGTGESAVGPTLASIALDPDGVDSEGLAIAPDGTFWISDEYGPHILHVSATGTTIERINPFGSGTGGRKIPLVYAKRRANRGMEGLAITPDGKIIVGIMQSTLDNPSTAVRTTSNMHRIVTFDVATGATHEYVYEDDAIGYFASDITALTSTTFLVDERDSNLPSAASAGQRKVYRIDISAATDITDPANGANGKLYNGSTPEQLTTVQRAAFGITPVTKTLIYDLGALPGGYPHDKFEGLAVVGHNLLVVVNDDDFGIMDNGQMGIAPKMLTLNNKQDRMTMYFIRLQQNVK